MTKNIILGVTGSIAAFKAAKKEMEASKHYDYCVINDRLDDAVKEIEGLLQI